MLNRLRSREFWRSVRYAAAGLDDPKSFEAKDLPEGSVVATDYMTWVRRMHGDWYCEDAWWDDQEVQKELDAGAVVLRIGFNRYPRY